MEFLQELTTNLQSFLLSIGLMGGILSCLLILIESILPCMPLCIFITIIFYTFGDFFGLIICWLFTCLGCIISYKICKSKLRKFVTNKLIPKLGVNTQNKINNAVDYIKGLSTSSLTVLIALPFSPAFVINIAAGIANVDKKKFYTSIFIGKLFMVYFWGYVGTSLLESISNPFIIIKVIVMMVGAYILSKVSNKIFKFE